MNDCLFCQMVAGKVPIHKVWEDSEHLAFLTIFPNTVGTTVVIPKKHYGSDVFMLDDAPREKLLQAAGKVAHQLEANLDDVGRCAVVFEGFGVDHVHAKLYPLHGTEMKDWRPIEAHIDKVFGNYPGYITTQEGPRGSDVDLAKLAEKISRPIQEKS